MAKAVQLSFDSAHSPSSPEEVRQLLVRLRGKRVKSQGILEIEAKQHRTQEQNRREALERLVELIRQAARRPNKRRKTRPTAASHERRLEEKRRRGLVKRLWQDKTV